MIEEFLSSLDDQLAGWVALLNTALATSWLGSGMFRSLVILFVVLYGYALFTGRIKSPVEDSIGKLFLIAVVAGVIFFPDLVIGGYFYPFFSTAPFDLAAMLPSPPTAELGGSMDQSAIFARIDDILESAFVTAGGILTEGDGWFLPFIHAMAILIPTLLTVIYALFLLVLAKFAIALLVGLAPLFIVMILFPLTRGMFERWLGLLFQYSLYPILALAILSFSTLWMTRQLNTLMASGPDASAADVAIYCIAAGLSWLLSLQVPQIAASIGGGLALSTMGVLGNAVARARGGIQNVTNRVSQRNNAQRNAATQQRQHEIRVYQAAQEFNRRTP